jgi:hypothetical protein
MKHLLLTFLVAALALSFAAAAGAAEAPLADPAAEEAATAPMSVEFPRRRATLVGPRALVPVKCSGLVAQTCEGTLVLRGVGGEHKVPYMIERGEKRVLVVPLGAAPADVDRGCTARVVARTLQLTGGTVRTSSLLKIG